ncbi:hypothetical protein Trydic_g7787 [Trypoxylus dichotomus]
MTTVGYYSEEFFIKGLTNEFKLSARVRQITKRSMLDSGDGNILDNHDQFYRDHKLLLKLFQVLGVMPIQRGQVGKITFSWLSAPTVYAYCFYAITTTLVVLVGYERLIILTKKSKNLGYATNTSRAVDSISVIPREVRDLIQEKAPKTVTENAQSRVQPNGETQQGRTRRIS